MIFLCRVKEVLQMCTDDRGQNDQNNQATTPALRAWSKKGDSDLVGKNEEKLRFCPSEKNMDKLLDDLSPFTYNTIVKYVRNSGKNIQHYPDYMVMKPFERGVNFFIEGYLHNVGAKHHKQSKTFYFRALCYPSLPKSEPPHKIRLAISTEQTYYVLASRPAPVSLDLWGFVIMP